MSTNPISKSTVALTALVLTGLGACLGLGFGLRTQIKSSLSETNQTTMNSVFIAESVTLTILLLLAGGGGEVGNNSSKSGVVVLFGIIGILFLISGALFASARSDIEQNPSVGSDAQNGYRLLYILSIIGGVVGILGVILYFYRKNKKSAEMTSQ
jgi:uncharacterized membrane protein